MDWNAEALIDAGTDVIVVDTAHGHSEGVLEAVSAVRKIANKVQIIGGNVATAGGAKALIVRGLMRSRLALVRGQYALPVWWLVLECPQLTAIMDAAEACEHKISR